MSRVVEEMFEKRGLKIRVEPKYKLFMPDQILDEINKISHDASEIIGFSPENCKILLYHFKWDPINLTEKFYEAASPKSFLEKNGVQLIDESVKSDIVAFDQCKNCKEIKEVFILSCRHMFCIDCWKTFVQFANEKSEDKNVLPYITCNSEECTTPVPETFILQIFSDQKNLYKKMVINSFVESNPEFKWCPNRNNGCEKAVKTEATSKVEEVTCTCGFTYCFNCVDIPHSPFPCIFTEKWKPQFSSYMMQLNDGFISCPMCCTLIPSLGRTGHISCTRCNNWFSASIFNPQEIHNNPRPEFKFYKFHETMLKKEYKLLRDLDDISTKNISALKIVLKQFHDFRHKFYHFHVFSYFLDRSQNYATFENRMTQMEDFLDKASKMIDSPEHSDETFYSEEKLKEIVNILVFIKITLDALLKSFYEDQWKFSDKEIEKVMLEYKY